MNYEEFKKNLLRKIKERLNIEVLVTQLEKNNQVKKEALTFQEAGVNMMPAIHLGELYERYKETDMEKCINFVLEVLKTRGYIMMEEILCDWKEAKNKIELQVINKKWNEERLKTLPHQDYLNLAVIARLGINEGKYVKSSMMVTYEMLDYWEISEKELFTAGLSNLKEKEFMIEDLEEVVLRAYGFLAEQKEEEKTSGIQYVMYNKAKINGANGLLRTDLLAKFADEQECDVWILPCSIHELILVPDRGMLDLKLLRSMVKDINDTEIEQEERLSDDVYKFCRERKMVALVE